MNIFVGNLNYASTEESIRALFEMHGEVTAVKVIKSWETGRSRGFGFVEMSNQDEARSAIEALDGSDLDGRPLKVNEARPRPDRRGGGPPRQDRW
jgi:cold-inducible RNA-binding protein